MALSPRTRAKFLVIDSGFGGLNVVAALERRLTDLSADAEIIYVNAAPSDELGYNQMNSTAEKTAVFRGVLASVATRFNPRATFIACNSLASLLVGPGAPKPPGQPTSSLIDLGANLTARFLERHRGLPIVILGTPTTIESGVLAAAIRRQVPEATEVVSQACPGLHTYISNHPLRSDVQSALRPHLRSALASLKGLSREVALFLGCTHYGYRATLFRDALKEEGVDPHILDPNEAMAEEIIKMMNAIPSPRPLHPEINIHFWSRFPLPPREISTISGYLQERSPASARAVQNYHMDADLFPLPSVTTKAP